MKPWVKDMLVRAVKTVIQTAFGTISACAVITEVDWQVVVATSITAGLLSVVMSICNYYGIEVEE